MEFPLLQSCSYHLLQFCIICLSYAKFLCFTHFNAAKCFEQTWIQIVQRIIQWMQHCSITLEDWRKMLSCVIFRSCFTVWNARANIGCVSSSLHSNISKVFWPRRHFKWADLVDVGFLKRNVRFSLEPFQRTNLRFCGSLIICIADRVQILVSAESKDSSKTCSSAKSSPFEASKSGKSWLTWWASWYSISLQPSLIGK